MYGVRYLLCFGSGMMWCWDVGTLPLLTCPRPHCFCYSRAWIRCVKSSWCEGIRLRRVEWGPMFSADALAIGVLGITTGLPEILGFGIIARGREQGTHWVMDTLPFRSHRSFY